MRSFCRKDHVHKIPRFRGGVVFWVFLGGGGSADFIFMGARIFLISIPTCSNVQFLDFMLSPRVCSRSVLPSHGTTKRKAWYHKQLGYLDPRVVQEKASVPI